MKESVNFIEGHQKASLLIDNTKKLFIMSQEGNANKGGNTTRTIFGIFMIVIYVGMGILLLINFFQWESGPWEWLRWVGGILLIVYGVWRGYRQFSGIDRNIGDEY